MNIKKIYLIYCDRTKVEEVGFCEKINVINGTLFQNTINKVKEHNFSKFYEYFDKRKTSRKFERIVNDINNDESKNIIFLTDKKDLFVKFEGILYVTDFTSFYYKNINEIRFDYELAPYNKLKNLELMYKNQIYFDLVKLFLGVEISMVLACFIKYNKFFSINIKSLIKKSAYKNIDKLEQLIKYMESDLKLFFEYGILPVRFCIVFIRLYSFNLDLSMKEIGTNLGQFFNQKNYSYRLRLKNTIKDSDLDNRSFRGFRFVYLNQKDYYITKYKSEIYNILKENNINKEIIKKVLGKDVVLYK
ncbi:hypothetical protein A7H1H_0855 [Aliarcobacter butzleri 7h1h]|uniref:Uncharacterized protein n=1 Tax=bioreactor metagenome TaxID=1076179 RepID=A0A644W529_9ZZZZ|nr:hypothetical protein [Aliarcobacter butzleri]AGR77159.1 hypothetical protein A7H1H_0855 [Aliarcobacter butzleri 7h1h]MCT7627037.1 hypothetical protein [Aliarcobacter butzleri]